MPAPDIEFIISRLENLHLANFINLVSPDLWLRDPEKALINVLRRYDRCDVMEYLNTYPDVVASRIDPLEHFIKFGLRENRIIKLLPEGPERHSFEEFMSRKLYFDCIISMGPDFRPAMQLRKRNLRYFASPFDWMHDYELKWIEYFIENGFKNFFQDFEIIGERRNIHIVRDKMTGMVSNYDFPASDPVEESLPFFQKQMNGRFRHLCMEIAQSNLVCFFGARENTGEVEHFRQFIMRKFGKSSYVVNAIVGGADDHVEFLPAQKTWLAHFGDKSGQEAQNAENPDSGAGLSARLNALLKCVKLY